jgi:hypothetical protein
MAPRLPGALTDSAQCTAIARAGSGWIATGLYSFQGGMDGAYPAASVTFGPEYSSSRLGNGSCREQFSRE